MNAKEKIILCIALIWAAFLMGHYEGKRTISPNGVVTYREPSRIEKNLKEESEALPDIYLAGPVDYINCHKSRTCTLTFANKVHVTCAVVQR